MSEDNVVPINEDILEEEPTEPTIMEATEMMAADLMKIAKRTKMSETGVMNVFSFVWQQNEAAKMRRDQQMGPSGQEMVDMVAREADEVVTSDD